MQTKKTFSLSLKIIIVIVIFSVVVGGGLVYSISKTISWGVARYQEMKTDRSDNLFSEIKNSFNKKSPQDKQVITVIDEQSQVIAVVEKASPAVVSIVASAEIPTFEIYYNSPVPNLPEEFQQFFGQVPQQRQNGTVEKRIGAGTGFIVSADGYIITNKHVVSESKADYTVYLNNEENRGERIKAQVIALDPQNDLAVLKIDKNNLPFLTFGDSGQLKVGQTAITIGYALGEFDNTVSKGVVSGLARSIVAGGGFNLPAENLKNLIQSDAAINPGNSGGPMLDLTGNVIGVNVAMASAQSIGFAILGNDARDVFQQVQQTGTITEKENAFLGVRYVPITQEIQKEDNLTYDYGALVMRGESPSDVAVAPGSAADQAGIAENDIILEINGEKITEKNQLSDLIAKYEPNDEVSLKIFQKGQEKILQIKLGKQ